jgi:hypothetical protein
MSKDYLFTCQECGWSGKRYSNLRVCPECGAPVRREDDKVLCYHGTTKDKADLILREGFKPDCWFSKHMEDAVNFGGNTILTVEFERKLLPKGWQFHVLEAIPPDRIKDARQIDALYHKPVDKELLKEGYLAMAKLELKGQRCKDLSDHPQTLKSSSAPQPDDLLPDEEIWAVLDKPHPDNIVDAFKENCRNIAKAQLTHCTPLIEARERERIFKQLEEDGVLPPQEER